MPVVAAPVVVDPTESPADSVKKEENKDIKDEDDVKAEKQAAKKAEAKAKEDGADAGSSAGSDGGSADTKAELWTMSMSDKVIEKPHGPIHWQNVQL